MHRPLHLLVGVAFFAAFCPATEAAFTPSVNAVTVASGEFVIDSDSTRAGAAYDRDEISVDTNVTFTGSGSGSNLYTLTFPAPAAEEFYRFRLALQP